jgi:hypothetical protein
MPKVRPYSGPRVLQNIDGRTKEGRLLRDTRAELIAHLGGKPSATQKALIDRAAMLTLHVALLDQKTLGGGSMTTHDCNQYLAWNSALAKLYRLLGLKGAVAAPPSLSAYVAGRAA